jgi:hypothetical protein
MQHNKLHRGQDAARQDAVRQAASSDKLPPRTRCSATRCLFRQAASHERGKLRHIIIFVIGDICTVIYILMHITVHITLLNHTVLSTVIVVAHNGSDVLFVGDAAVLLDNAA